MRGDHKNALHEVVITFQWLEITSSSPFFFLEKQKKKQS